MADTQIANLTAYTTASTADLLVIVDVSDTTMGPTGTDKQITFAQLYAQSSGDVTYSNFAATVVSINSQAIALGGSFTVSGAFTTTLTVTANTNVTLPTTGTLVTTAQTLAGTQTLSAASTTLSATSPSYNLLSTASNVVAAVLPAAATCPGKVFWFTVSSAAHAGTVTLNAADTYENVAAGGSITMLGSSNSAAAVFGIMSNGVSAWIPLFPALIASAQVFLTGTNGGLVWNAAGAPTSSAGGSAGQLWQSNGLGTAPTATGTPGSGTALTSITVATVNPTAALTPIIGSAGTYTWTQPFSGASYKKVIIFFNGYTNASTSAITFTTVFTNTPAIAFNGTALTISTISNTGVTIPTATLQTGFIILEGY